MQATDEKKIERLLVPIPEAAEALSLGRSTVYDLIASGDLPAVRIGRSVRIPITVLREWVEQQSATKLEGESHA